MGHAWSCPYQAVQPWGHTCTHAYACTHTHRHARTPTRTGTHAHTNAHTHAHTHPPAHQLLWAACSPQPSSPHGKVSMWRLTLPSLPRRASASAPPGSPAPRQPCAPWWSPSRGLASPRLLQAADRHTQSLIALGCCELSAGHALRAPRNRRWSLPSREMPQTSLGTSRVF